jgi:hypothetical protein
MSQNPADSVVKKVALLKELTDNPDSKITDIAKEVGISKSTAYTILQEFSKAFVMTEDEPNFPEKILFFYNNDLPGIRMLIRPPYTSLRLRLLKHDQSN